MWPPPIKPKMLIAIAILPLLLFCAKQTWAQEPANGMLQTYGLGEYTMDDKQQVMVPDDALLLKTTEEVMNYKTNKHTDKQFKPCMMELNNDNKFQLVYDEDAAKHGCTVDLVIGPSEDEKTFHAEIKVMDPMGCLDNCGVKSCGGLVEESIGKELVASGANLFPFTYSLSNEEFKKLHKGPPYKEDQTCEPECAKYGGKCMTSATSPQIAWNKCETKIKAWILLVGESYNTWYVEQEVRGKEAAIDLIIARGSNPTVTMQIERGDNIYEKTVFPNDDHGKPKSPPCFTDHKMVMIPELKFWTIKSDNAELNGKHLLVFHFLPQTATRIFNEKGILKNAPEPGMPKCKGKLAIAFENVAGLLQSPTSLPPSTPSTKSTSNRTGPPTTAPSTESTTGETATSTGNITPAPTEAVTTAPKITAPGIYTGNEKATPTTGETAASTGTPNATEAVTMYSGILFVVMVSSVVVMLFLIGVLVWCLCCGDNGEDDNEEENATEEGAEE